MVDSTPWTNSIISGFEFLCTILQNVFNVSSESISSARSLRAAMVPNLARTAYGSTLSWTLLRPAPRNLQDHTTVSPDTLASSCMLCKVLAMLVLIPNRRSNLSVSRQETPTSSQTGLWCKVLCHILCPDPSIKHLCLIRPLGIWHAPSNMIWESSMWDGSNLYR